MLNLPVNPLFSLAAASRRVLRAWSRCCSVCLCTLSFRIERGIAVSLQEEDFQASSFYQEMPRAKLSGF